MNNGYSILINKLEDFIKRFYRNRIIQGTFLCGVIMLTAVLLFSFLEYLSYFPIIIRTILFFTLLFGFIFILIRYIISPLLKYLKIGKVLSYEEASNIISSHFSDIQDKLLNILELSKSYSNELNSNELALAAIEQKAKAITPLSFPQAIDFSKVRKLSRILLVIVLLTAGILVVYPSIFKEGTFRILHHQTAFTPPAPFSFHLLNKTLSATKGDDYMLELQIEGKFIPNEVFVAYGGNSFAMKKKTKKVFTYLFKAINNSLDFNFQADKYTSDNFTLKVLPTPTVLNFKLSYEPPAYTLHEAKELTNIGDIVVPVGTKVNWSIRASSTDEIAFKFDSSASMITKKDGELFSLEKRLMKSEIYTISAKNKFIQKDQFVNYSLKVIPDLYPTIEVNLLQDSINRNIIYFKGLLGDDYGISDLRFSYQLEEDNKIKKSEVLPVSILGNLPNQEFYYAFDFSKIQNPENLNVKYFFEVYDNDGVNGRKSTRSQSFEFKIPSLEELERIQTEASKGIQDKMEQSQKLVDELQKSVSELQKDLQDPNTSQWKKVSDLNKISQKQQALEQALQQMNQLNQEKNSQLNSFSEQEQKILDKQKQIEELMNNLLSDDLKKLIDEINKMKDKVIDQKKLNDITNQLKFDYKDLEKQLDRNMELLKQYEIEEKIGNMIQQLDKLSEDQQKLSEEILDKNANKEDIQREQQEQSERYNEIMKQYEEAKDKNEELKNPLKLDNLEEDDKQIDQDFGDSKQNMDSKKSSKASQSMKKTANDLKKMSQKMSGMMEQNEQEMAEENADDLKQLIKNILGFSFSQEALINDLKGISISDPKYQTGFTKQTSLADDFKVIEDSLNALRTRTPQIGSAIDKDMNSIKQGQRNLVPLFENRKIGAINTTQQNIMTSANNLALLLGEVLQQMMDSQSQSGDGSCNKPKKGKGKKSGNKPSFGDVGKMQQSLKKQLEKMLQQMQNGENPGGMNEQLAKMLSQQEILAKMLQDLKNKGGLQNSTMQKLDEISKMIEDTQKDLINKNITPTTINRQQQIQTRLLEAENAENEREIDKKRQSNENKDILISNPSDAFKNQLKKNSYKEEMNYGNLKMQEFYQNKYKQYLNTINQK